MKETKTAKPRAPSPLDGLKAERTILTVTALTASLRELVEKRFGNVWVEGELSNLTRHGSGHWYFTLKDEGAQLRAVMFRGSNARVRFRPEDGLAVLCRGRLSVYEKRGDYQLLVEEMEPRGAGALQLAFEQLKQKLEAEGLFASARKRPLPMRPRRVGLVTSPTGAAIRDLLQVIGRRDPTMSVLLAPARVQGEGAAAEIADALSRLAATGAVDVIICGRGGGSAEDLWAFNEEPVARAIAACSVPVVSAVGHEVDFTIADFVADVRAPTPSAAAELVVPVREELVLRVAELQARLRRALERRVVEARHELLSLRGELGDPRRELAMRRMALDDATNRLATKVRELERGARRKHEALAAALRQQHPSERLHRARLALRELDGRLSGILDRPLAARRERLVALDARLRTAFERQRGGANERLAVLAAKLHALSPLAILGRGFALARKPGGAIVTDAARVKIGERLELRLAKGQLDVRVEGGDARPRRGVKATTPQSELPFGRTSTPEESDDEGAATTPGRDDERAPR